MTGSAYSFLPWLRRGIATGITQPPSAAARASVTVRLRLEGTAVAGGGTLTQPVQHDVALYGPGDVVGVDRRAVVRTDPQDGVTNFDPNYLPLVEFYDEDIPWRYSPDVPDPATGRLRPWLALVVLADDELTDVGTPPGSPLPRVDVGDLGRLPPPAELGAWAHVHVNGTVTASDQEVVATDMAAVLPRLAAVVAANPDRACSRLLCPRRLDPEAGYVALLVPAFETGRLAGLGRDPAAAPGAVHSSWEPYPGRPEPTSLPYYARWRFRTAPLGDFEYLVRRLQRRPVDARVGHRDLDVLDPGAGLPGIVDPPDRPPEQRLGGVLRLGGALQAPDEALDEQEKREREKYEDWDQPYPQDFQQALAALVNLGDEYLAGTARDAHGHLAVTAPDFAASGAVPADHPDPLVTPPLYGRWHALRSRLLTAHDGTPLDPDDDWLHELNLDPRFRVAAGTGARVVRAHDEEFMQAAWDQLGEVLAANRRIRAAQVAREVGYVHHARHLQPLAGVSSGQALALTALLHSGVLAAPATGSGAAGTGAAGAAVPGATGSAPPPLLTVAASVADSVVAAAPLSPAMRRITRPGSRLMRGLPFGTGTGTGTGPSVGMDGVVGPGPAPGTSPAAGTGMGTGTGTGTGPSGGFDLVVGPTGPAVPGATPPASSPSFPAPAPARQDLLARMNAGEVTAAPPKVTPPGVVSVDALERVLAGPVIGLHAAEPAERLLLLLDPVPNPVSSLPTSADFVVSLPGDDVRPTAGGADSVEATRFKQALNDAYGAFNSAANAGLTTPRTRLDLTGVTTATLDGLHPDLTVPRRALGGLVRPARLVPAPGGDGPGGDPRPPVPRVADAAEPAEPDPLGEVMAYPVIDLPMFRPLAELSAELFCPNVNLVPPDSITLLETNPRFVESYLVGLNHEMARELLWREYPTDQRGSVFRQFWDTRSVLPRPGETAEQRRERLRDIPPIHTWAKGSELGGHDHRGAAGDRLVLAIRGELLKKYPTAVIYAQHALWARRPDGSIDLTRSRTLDEPTEAEAADPPPTKIRMPAFEATVAPDISFFGFDLTAADALGGAGTGDAGWFFVLKERQGEPRFGLDIAGDVEPEVWNDLAWPHVLPASGGPGPAYLRLAGQATRTLRPPTDPAKAAQHAEDRALTWTAQINPADLAYVLFQAPVLVAVHAREMLRHA